MLLEVHTRKQPNDTNNNNNNNNNLICIAPVCAKKTSVALSGYDVWQLCQLTVYSTT